MSETCETPDPPPQSRPLRADAERNRQAILCAAGLVFAREGIDVSLERIAQTAGVGVGTIYRRFGSVDELVAVVMTGKMTRYADQSEQSAARAVEDPWGAFEDYVLFMLGEQEKDIAFSDLILRPRGTNELFRVEIGRALDASMLLVDRARASGRLRGDFDHSDLYLLLTANAGVIRAMEPIAPRSSIRFGHYMLQAFQTMGRGTLPPAPSEWARLASARTASRPRAVD